MSNNPRILLNGNVFNAAEQRLDYLFSEFERPFVSTSGGKDSTVIIQLALRAAERAGKLPMDVFYLDQEVEYDCVIQSMRKLREDERVRLHWLQIPFVTGNSSSGDQHWTNCWEEGVEWMREKEPDSVHENTLGTNRFYQIFDAYLQQQCQLAGLEPPYCTIAGIRAEESSKRLRELGSPKFGGSYKDITWVSHRKRSDAIIFCPIYDWTWRDVWKAIHENNWPYLPVYDYMYQTGMNPSLMRVSSFTHSRALRDMNRLHEFEPETWNRLQKRIKGVNASKHLKLSMLRPTVLPRAFESWLEYRDYLLKHLVEPDSEMRKGFDTNFGRRDRKYLGTPFERSYLMCCVDVILKYDYLPESNRLNQYDSEYRVRWRRYEQKRAARAS